MRGDSSSKSTEHDANPCQAAAFARPTPKVKALSLGDEDVADPWSLLPQKAFDASRPQSSQDGEVSGGLPSESSSCLVIPEAPVSADASENDQVLQEAEAEWYGRLHEEDPGEGESQLSDSQIQEELDHIFAQYEPRSASCSSQQSPQTALKPSEVQPLCADRAFLDLQRVAVESLGVCQEEETVVVLGKASPSAIHLGG